MELAGSAEHNADTARAGVLSGQDSAPARK